MEVESDGGVGQGRTQNARHEHQVVVVDPHCPSKRGEDGPRPATGPTYTCMHVNHPALPLAASSPAFHDRTEVTRLVLAQHFGGEGLVGGAVDIPRFGIHDAFVRPLRLHDVVEERPQDVLAVHMVVALGDRTLQEDRGAAPFLPQPLAQLTLLRQRDLCVQRNRSNTRRTRDHWPMRFVDVAHATCDAMVHWQLVHGTVTPGQPIHRASTPFWELKPKCRARCDPSVVEMLHAPVSSTSVALVGAAVAPASRSGCTSSGNRCDTTRTRRMPGVGAANSTAAILNC